MPGKINISVDELLRGVDFEGSDAEATIVTGISYSSLSTKAGDAFFCVVGLKSDGHAYARDAARRGAVAIVCQHRVDGVDIPQYVVSDSRLALALASHNAFEDPSSRLELIGVTGTNGKTTTTYLVEWILRSIGRKTGIIGTIETRIAGQRQHATRTTPESYDLAELLAEMVDAGVDDVAMEVSSHAIDLDRIAGCHFACVAFSNLTQDHLDYHKTMENYFQAKLRLFTDYGVKRCAVCVDDEYGRRVARAARDAGSDVLTCGMAPTCDVFATAMTFSSTQTSFRMTARGEDIDIHMPLVGRFNVENALLAATVCLQMGVNLESIGEALANSPQVPGRLERVRSTRERPFTALVDYSHTPDAIEKAVEVVKDITRGRTIVVFGCGGDRDATKRPKMGRAALGGDYAIVTSDNPRTEDPDAIIEDILPGMAGEEDRYEVVVDRREAIARACAIARPGDCILIAGKGHEDYQLVGDKVLDFDDRVVAAQEMDAL